MEWRDKIKQKGTGAADRSACTQAVNMQMHRHFYWECKKPTACANYFKSTKIYCIEVSYMTSTRHRAEQFTLTKASLLLVHGNAEIFWGRKFASTLNITVLTNHFGRLSFTTLIWKYTKDSTLSCKTAWKAASGKSFLPRRWNREFCKRFQREGKIKAALTAHPWRLTLQS